MFTNCEDFDMFIDLDISHLRKTALWAASSLVAISRWAEVFDASIEIVASFIAHESLLTSSGATEKS